MVKFVPVDPSEIPNFHQGRRGRVAYPIIKAFMESNAVVAKLDRSSLAEGTNRSLMSLTTGLSTYIKNHDLALKVFQREGEIYLARLDLNADGTPNLDYKSPQQEPPLMKLEEVLNGSATGSEPKVQPPRVHDNATDFTEAEG